MKHIHSELEFSEFYPSRRQTPQNLQDHHLYLLEPHLS